MHHFEPTALGISCAATVDSPLFYTAEMATLDAGSEKVIADEEKAGQDNVMNGHDNDSSSNQDEANVEKPPVNPWMDPTAFPDGGTKAWLSVAGASACLFVSFGWINCIGVFQEYYSTHQLQQYNASEIAWIPALQSG